MVFAFEHTYAALPERFFSRPALSPVAAPRLIRVNEKLARELGLDPAQFATPEAVAILAGNTSLTGTTPIALAYAGHQFGNFVPQLGDGRALLLGEIIDRKGQRRDIQLKGSGPTAFSRRGDGRAALGPVLREYIVSEAMAAFGIPTTRTLAAGTTGETVLREGPLPGAVLTRVAASHIRIGTFQFFAAQGDQEAVRLLADYVIQRHYPSAAENENPYRSLLEQVIAAQASLIAAWLSVGFIHGVMNTDNMSIAGETIDYGPCAFMDAYDPATVFSSIDRHGRYAYGNQPPIALWNLTRFAECLLPLLDADEGKAVTMAEEALQKFDALFADELLNIFRGKIGLSTARDSDGALIQDLLKIMASHQADFTLTFRALGDAVVGDAGQQNLKLLFANPAALAEWLPRWRRRFAEEPQSPEQKRAAMDRRNPLYIPRNHLVEEAIRAAVDQQDFTVFESLLGVLDNPFDEQPGLARYTQPATPEQRVYQTFCGT